MGTILTRQTWNQLVQSVNDLASNPPNGCNPAPTLSEVPVKHRWSVADVQAMRDTLTAICGDNTFDAPLNKWKQPILSELYDAYFRGWCGCEAVPCTDPVTYGLGGFPYSPYPWGDNMNVLAGNESGQCWASSRPAQGGWINGVYPLLDGYQVYGDFYWPEYGAQTMQNIRTWAFRKHYDDYWDEGLCPGHPIHLGDVLLHGGELQGNGSVGLWSGGQDPDVPGGFYLITNNEWDWVPWPHSFHLDGNCFSIGLDNFAISEGLPGGTHIGNLVCSDPRYTVNLVGLGYPNPYTDDVMQVGSALRSRRTFHVGEDVHFTLRATGLGTVVYGPFDRTFRVRIT